MKANGFAHDGEPESLPPHLPWVLLCHVSGGSCGSTVTVNHVDEWKAALTARRVHENFCTKKPGGAFIAV